MCAFAAPMTPTAVATAVKYRARTATAIVALALTVPALGWAQGAGLAGLYAAQPPAGSAFVRLAHVGTPPIQVVLGSVNTGVAQSLPPAAAAGGGLATAYKVVNPAKPWSLWVNGTVQKVDLQPQAGTYATWVVQGVSAPFQLVAVTDELAPANALRAVLRLSNLVPGCALSLRVAGGPEVFDRVEPWHSKARLINPIKVAMVARCDAAESGPLALPALQAGDRYSLFVVGTAAKPELVGQMDTTEPYSEP